jgi:hypothetical protein
MNLCGWWVLPARILEFLFRGFTASRKKEDVLRISMASFQINLGIQIKVATKSQNWKGPRNMLGPF